MLTRQHVLRGWGFGDGAPNLDRQRPMLFEECAQRLFDLEEMEYSLPTDETQYVASAQSRFVKPEIVAVLGDHPFLCGGIINQDVDQGKVAGGGGGRSPRRRKKKNA